MKSATKNTKINEIYKYIQKLYFLEKSTKNQRKFIKIKNIQNSTKIR